MLLQSLVEKQFFTFGYPPEEFLLESGRMIGPVTLAYEIYGQLNNNKDNVILIAHGLSADSHAAGRYLADDKYPGWWEGLIGAEKAFDTNRYCVICSNVLGSCKGSSGPSTIYPITGKPYGMLFPIVTIKDMIHAQKKLMEYLGIQSLVAVAGGSMGGQQALQWGLTYPDFIQSIIPVAVSGRLSPQGIAFNEIGRQCIMADPDWNHGDYYHQQTPRRGLALARMVGHITFLSDEKLNQRFGRKKQKPHVDPFDFESQFEIESYLHYKGDSFVDKFDANSYMYMMKAIDLFDISANFESFEEAIQHLAVPGCYISFSSDWLFPPREIEDLVEVLIKFKKPHEYHKVISHHGHDSFLIDFEPMNRLIVNFLKKIENKDYES